MVHIRNKVLSFNLELKLTQERTKETMHMISELNTAIKAINRSTQALTRNFYLPLLRDHAREIPYALRTRLLNMEIPHDAFKVPLNDIYPEWNDEEHDTSMNDTDRAAASTLNAMHEE